MNINNYLLSQSLLVKNQLNKNHKIVKELVLPKSQNSINTSKEKSISVHDVINPKKNIAGILKDENDFFIQMYSKTKKLYPTKIEETFKDLIVQYQNIDYKIPDLSDKKNLFNQNPLLLVGRDLDQFYLYNDKNKNPDINIKTQLRKKHVDFIKKEMLFMEKMAINSGEMSKKHKNSLSNNNDNNDMDDEVRYRNEKINYFLVDSVWDKINETKLKLEKEKNKKNKIKLKLLDKKNNKNKINKSVDIINNSKKNNKRNNKIEKHYSNNINNIHYKYSSNKKSKEINNLKNINNNGTIKYFPSIDIMPTKCTFKNKNSNNINKLHTIKIKNNLLNNINIKDDLFKNNEESNKLQKEINEIKNTLNNSDLIEKNIILEDTHKRKSKSNKTTINSFLNKTVRSSSIKGNDTLILNNKERLFTHYHKKIKSPSDTIPEENNNNNNNNNNINNNINNKESKLNGLKLFEMIKKRTIPFFTINKIVKEKDPKKFLELLSKVNLKILNRKEIEKLMKSYCEKILRYNEKDTENIINVKKNDENIYKNIEKIIQKTKNSPHTYYGKYNLRVILDDVNKNIYDLKKKYIYGKTEYNYEA